MVSKGVRQGFLGYQSSLFTGSKISTLLSLIFD